MRHLAVLLFSAMLSLQASATPWTEIDAGQLPASAEVPTGGHIDSISGDLTFDIDTSLWDVDLYAIRIQNPGAFSARTIFESVDESMTDPVLYLFGPDGRGVVVNDDTTFDDLQSTIPTGSVSGPAGAIYYLAIAWAFSDALSDSGPIFPLYESGLATTGVYGPTGSGGADPLTSWLSSGPVDFDVPAGYRIELTGARAVPEPGTLALLGIGVLLLGVRALRHS